MQYSDLYHKFLIPWSCYRQLPFAGNCCLHFNILSYDEDSKFTPVSVSTHLSTLSHNPQDCNYLLLQIGGKKMDFHLDKVTVFYSACHSNKSLLGYYAMFTFISQPLNSKAVADSWSFFYFKCPRLYFHKTALSLSGVNSYCPVCVIQVKIINVF